MKGRQLDRDRLHKNRVRFMSLTGFCYVFNLIESINTELIERLRGRSDQTVLATHFTLKNTKSFANVGCF